MKIIFIILFLVLLGELGYVFMTVNKKNPTSFIVPTPTLNSRFESTKPKIDFNSCIDMLSNYYRSDIATLSTTNYYLENNIANTSYVVTELQGEIISFDKAASRKVEKNYIQEFYIKLERDVDGKKETFDIIFNSDLLQKTKVEDFSGKIISHKELKIGQTLKVIKTYDLKKNILSDINIRILDK